MRPSRLTPLLAALALLLSPLAAPGAATSGPGDPRESPSDGAGCVRPVFDAPVRAATARAAVPGRFAEALDRNQDAAGVVRRAARTDPSLWLDRCGRAFYREALRSEDVGQARADPVLPRGTDVFALSSRPGAERVIHLDFRGHQVRDTAWNGDRGPFTAEPFTMDDDPSTFDAAERMQIYKTWLTVAEDYAPFAVDVTTADPGDDAITRSSESDRRFGSRVVVSAAPAVSDGCGCAGVAYLGTFDTTWSHAYYQPAWAFATGPDADGWAIGEIASHEVGHNLGLDHDGDAGSGYHWGTGLWAPIMGLAYDRTLTQFSAGEYAGATNQQDDLAVIDGHGAPVLADDHGGPAAPTPVGGTARPVDGTITAPDDVDAFRFSGSGRTVVTARPTSTGTNLAVSMRLLAADGSLVARVDPVPRSGDARPSPTWLGATWTGTLPDSGGPWTVVVDGAELGEPRAGGGQSDYGSLGPYAVTVETVPESEPEPEPEPELVFRTPSALPDARLGRWYRRVVRVDGPATSVLRRTAGSLPPGISRTADGRAVVLAGRARRTGVFRFVLRADSPGGQSAARTFRLRVRR